jgi:hypothetical protein
MSFVRMDVGAVDLYGDGMMLPMVVGWSFCVYFSVFLLMCCCSIVVFGLAFVFCLLRYSLYFGVWLLLC